MSVMTTVTRRCSMSGLIMCNFFICIVFSNGGNETGVIGWSQFYGGTEGAATQIAETESSSAYIQEICFVAPPSESFIEGVYTVTFTDGNISGPFVPDSNRCTSTEPNADCFDTLTIDIDFNFVRALHITDRGSKSIFWVGDSAGTEYAVSGASDTCLTKLEWEPSTTDDRVHRMRFHFGVPGADVPTAPPVTPPSPIPTSAPVSEAPTSAPTSSTAAPTPLPTSSPSYVPTSSTAAPSATPLYTTIGNATSPVSSVPASTISVMTTTAALFGVNISITVHNTVAPPAVAQLTAVLEREALDMTVLTSDCNESVNAGSVIEDDRTIIYVVIASCSEESEELLIAHYEPVRLERDVIGIGLIEAEVEVRVEAIGAADERPAAAAGDQDDAVWGWWPFAWISPWIGVAVMTAAAVGVSVTICSCVCIWRSKRRRKSASAANESNDACGGGIGIGAMSDGPERANTAIASSTVTPRSRPPSPRAPPVPPPALPMVTTTPGDSGPYCVDVPSIMANAHYRQESIQSCGSDESDSEELYLLPEHESGQQPQQLGVQTQGAGDADEIQAKGNVLSDVLCAECGAVRAGRVDDIDGRFYCRECWADFGF